MSGVPHTATAIVPLLIVLIFSSVGCGDPGRGSFAEEASPERLAELGAAGRAAGFNLVLMTVDTLRADRLGCYGHGPAQTPAMD